MRVLVRLYAGLGRQVAEATNASATTSERVASPLEVSLPPRTTVAGLLAYLGLPAQSARIIFVNGLSRDSVHVLGPDDEVGIFPAIGGG